MRIILLRFLSYVYVPALNESLKEYSDSFCIAYKGDSSSPVYIITNSNAVVDYLCETNPNCHEITVTGKFLENELKDFLLTNPEFLKPYLEIISR